MQLNKRTPPPSFIVKSSIIWLLVGLVSCSQPAPKQKTGTPQVPTQEYYLPEELTYSPKQDDLPSDRIYPIGWSPKGELAYIVLEEPGESGLFFFKIVVHNMYNGNVAWSETVNADNPTATIEAIWAENYNAFKQALANLQVKQLQKLVFGRPSFSHKGKRYRLSCQAHFAQDTAMGDQEATAASFFIGDDNEAQAREFWSESYQKGAGVLDAGIGGYLLDPYHDFICVVAYAEHRGLGGSPNSLSVDLLSCDLTAVAQ